MGPNVEFLTAGGGPHVLEAAPGSQLTVFRRDGQVERVSAEREQGRPVYSATVTLATGVTQTLEYEWTLPHA